MSTNFTFTPLSMGGVYKIELRRFGDTRGFFKELYHKENFLARGISDEFIQDNFSYSHKNVIRGLHVRKVPHQESKLVSCTLG
jgi:dTDP-4-dehydrorhamnose 3,5-epimerase